MKKELVLYAILFIFLATIQHTDLHTNPSSRFDRLLNDGQQSIFHPFIWATPIYMIVLMFRLIVKWMRRFFTKK